MSHSAEFYKLSRTGLPGGKKIFEKVYVKLTDAQSLMDLSQAPIV